MGIVAGVDGCKIGWFCVSKDLENGKIEFGVHYELQSLFRQSPKPAMIAIDMPIGLPETGSRQCDIEARRLLGAPRHSSVFPAPVRAALGAKTRGEADEIHREVDGREVSPYSFGIYPKIKELDKILQADEELRRRVKEIHPEVCFCAWNANKAMRHPKKTKEGQTERRHLVSKFFGEVILDTIRDSYRTTHVANDDIYDALAALWTAERILQGRATVIPDTPPMDATGLPMEMWY